jgi:hypothetical protein
VSDTVRPRQILLLGFDIDRTGGVEFTIIEMDPDATQLAELVPMIEIMVLLVGATTIIVLVLLPVLQV